MAKGNKKTASFKQCKLLGIAESCDLVEQLRERLRPYVAATDSRLVEVLQQCTPLYATTVGLPVDVAQAASKSPLMALEKVFSMPMAVLIMTDPAYACIEMRVGGIELPDEWVPVKEWIEEMKLRRV